MSPRLGAQGGPLWTNDSAGVLMGGIAATEQGRRLAEARLKALHPIPHGKQHYSTDFEKRLRKIFEKQSEDQAQRWLDLEFWQREIDNVLVQGIFGGHGSKAGVVERIHA